MLSLLEIGGLNTDTRKNLGDGDHDSYAHRLAAQKEEAAATERQAAESARSAQADAKRADAKHALRRQRQVAAGALLTVVGGAIASVALGILPPRGRSSADSTSPSATPASALNAGCTVFRQDYISPRADGTVASVVATATGLTGKEFVKAINCTITDPANRRKIGPDSRVTGPINVDRPAPTRK
ncbi:MAG TPA: hypothetical protein VLG67_03010 [Candidatus Saccharimonadales bacterium]|nr:hypothetical protein [Candidatus Saccharimonadales bacterium]